METMNQVAMNERGESAPRPTPFRAMLWKEWRESWWMLLLTIFAPPALIWLMRDHRLVEALPVGLLIFPAALGARLFAADAARGTALFQDERPVARKEVFKVRLILPCVALVAGLVLTGSALIRTSEHPADARMAGLLAIGTTVVCFTSSVLCSIILDRPATALAAGGVTTVAVMLALGFAVYFPLKWLSPIMAVDPYAREGSEFMIIYTLALPVIGIALLFLSRWAFVRQGRT